MLQHVSGVHSTHAMRCFPQPPLPGRSAMWRNKRLLSTNAELSGPMKAEAFIRTHYFSGGHGNSVRPYLSSM